jgi:hypothetical protein
LPIGARFFIKNKEPIQWNEQEHGVDALVFEATLDNESPEKLLQLIQGFISIIPCWQRFPSDIRFDMNLYKHFIKTSEFKTNTGQTEIIKGFFGTPNTERKIFKSTIVPHTMDIGSSTFFKATDKDNRTSFIKCITKRSNSNKSKRGLYYKLSRVLNEILATYIYNFYGLNTFQYKIIINDDKIKGMDEVALVSEVIEGIDYKIGLNNTNNTSNSKDKSNLYQEIANEYLIDCILSNWDVGNNNNIGVYKGRTIRTDVGGALMYSGRGDIKMNFNSFGDPSEHIIYLDENLGTGKFFQKVFSSILRDGNIDIGGLLYAKLESVKIDTLKKQTRQTVNTKLQTDTRIRELQEEIHRLELTNAAQFVSFIDYVVDVVVYRHMWYLTHKEKVIQDIKSLIQISSGGKKMKLQRKHLQTTPIKIPKSEKMKKYKLVLRGGTDIVQSPPLQVTPSGEIKEKEVVLMPSEVFDALVGDITSGAVCPLPINQSNKTASQTAGKYRQTRHK